MKEENLDINLGPGLMEQLRSRGVPFNDVSITDMMAIFHKMGVVVEDSTKNDIKKFPRRKLNWNK